MYSKRNFHIYIADKQIKLNNEQSTFEDKFHTPGAGFYVDVVNLCVCIFCFKVISPYKRYNTVKEASSSVIKSFTHDVKTNCKLMIQYNQNPLNF